VWHRLPVRKRTRRTPWPRKNFAAAFSELLIDTDSTK
jgi:hypothetical protein